MVRFRHFFFWGGGGGVFSVGLVTEWLVLFHCGRQHQSVHYPLGSVHIPWNRSSCADFGTRAAVYRGADVTFWPGAAAGDL